MAAQGRVTLGESIAECVAWADFVFTSIRVGGIDQRIRDEAPGAAPRDRRTGDGRSRRLRDGGADDPADGALCARDCAEAAPHAWIVNFTNPVRIASVTMPTGL